MYAKDALFRSICALENDYMRCIAINFMLDTEPRHCQ